MCTCRRRIEAKNGRILDRIECAGVDEILNLFSDLEDEVKDQVLA